MKVLKALLDIVIEKLDDIITLIPSRKRQRFDFLIDKLIEEGVSSAITFDYLKIKRETINYLTSLRISEHNIEYKFSHSQKHGNLYASVYALLTLDLYDDVKNFSTERRNQWLDYLNSFQNYKDGLWYDKRLINEHFADSDWWGARHLSIHMFAAYTALGSRPKYPITYIKKYYDLVYMQKWLDDIDWQSYFDHENDIDNQLMNVGVALQYQRDYFDDTDAAISLEFLIEYLDGKQNSETGLWVKCDLNDPAQLSRAVQFTYHILTLYFYENRQIKNNEKILQYALQTQNRLGGFGVSLNSSACEDIDSIELIVQLSKNSDEIPKKALSRAFVWILSNKMNTGGFIFRQQQGFWYGHDILSSKLNEGNVFATWFRTLSLAKLSGIVLPSKFYKKHKAPGY